MKYLSEWMPCVLLVSTGCTGGVVKGRRAENSQELKGPINTSGTGTFQNKRPARLVYLVSFGPIAIKIHCFCIVFVHLFI